MKKMKGEKMANETNISGMRQKTHESVDKIMDKAERIRDGGKKAMACLKEKAVTMKENVDGYIQKNPKKTVLISAGIGAVAGAIISAAIIRKRQIELCKRAG